MFMFPTFDSFNDLFDKVTDNYECMVIVNKKSSPSINEKIFWYKATLPKELNKID